MGLGDRIVVMEQGLVQQVGPPQAIYDRPANTFVATFLGSPGVEPRCRWAEDELLGFRPEHLQPATGRRWASLRLSHHPHRIPWAPIACCTARSTTFRGRTAPDAGAAAEQCYDAAAGGRIRIPLPSRSRTGSTAAAANGGTAAERIADDRRAGAGRGSLLDSRRLMGFAFLAPAVLYIILLIGVPFFTAIAYSFSNATVGQYQFQLTPDCATSRMSGTRRTSTPRCAIRSSSPSIAQFFVLILANMLALILTAPLRTESLGARRHVGRAAAADHAVGDAAGAVRHRLAVDVRLQVQPDRLRAGADRPAWARGPCGAPPGT